MEGVTGRYPENRQPDWLRSGNGSEFITQVLKGWLSGLEQRTRYIDLGCPCQNVDRESFNGRLRDECLPQEP